LDAGGRWLCQWLCLLCSCALWSLLYAYLIPDKRKGHFCYIPEFQQK
jgi:hypothetical protein